MQVLENLTEGWPAELFDISVVGISNRTNVCVIGDVLLLSSHGVSCELQNAFRWQLKIRLPARAASEIKKQNPITNFEIEVRCRGEYFFRNQVKLCAPSEGECNTPKHMVLAW